MISNLMFTYPPHTPQETAATELHKKVYRLSISIIQHCEELIGRSDGNLASLFNAHQEAL